MNTTIQDNRTWSTTHRINAEDKTAMSAMRVIVEPNKGRLQGTAARVPFDAIMERVAAPAGVTYEAGTVGGVSGLVVPARRCASQTGNPSSARWMV